MLKKIYQYLLKKIVKRSFYGIIKKSWLDESSYSNQFLDVYQIQKTATLFSVLIDAEAVMVGSFDYVNSQIETLAFITDDGFKERITIPAEFFDFDNYQYNFLTSKIVILPVEKISSTLGLQSKSIAYIPLLNNKIEIIGVLAIFINSDHLSIQDKNIFFYFASFFSSELHLFDLRKKLVIQNEDLKRTQIELEQKNTLLSRLNSVLSHSQKITKESIHLKSAFLSNMSHEIKTPMNVILGFNELLNSKYLNEDEIREYTTIIRNSGNQLLQIIDSLIDISKIQANEMVTVQRPFSINNLLIQIYDFFAPRLLENKKNIVFKRVEGLEEGKDLIKNSKESIFKVLQHLVDNAFKFTDSGEIVFGYEPFEKHLLFFVKDTGIGISKKDEPAIFDIFRQLDLSKTREYGGNGLGLNISKKLVEAMNGKIWYEPDRQKGSCFYFTVPKK